MVAGYFIYEQLILSYSLPAAFAEVPFNIVQMIIGLIVAVPIVYAVRRVFPQLKS
jgi:urea transporter